MMEPSGHKTHCCWGSAPPGQVSGPGSQVVRPSVAAAGCGTKPTGWPDHLCFSKTFFDIFDEFWREANGLGLGLGLKLHSTLRGWRILFCCARCYGVYGDQIRWSTYRKVDIENPDRGPLLIISGEKDNTAPWAIANASFKEQQQNVGATEIIEIPNRGHGLTADGEK